MGTGEKNKGYYTSEKYKVQIENLGKGHEFNFA